MGTVEVKKPKSRTPDPQNKAVRYGIKHTKITETNNKSIVQKEGLSANMLNRNRSLRWSTTRSNSKNKHTQNEEHTSTLQLRNSVSMKSLSGRKRKLEDELNILLKARLPPKTRTQRVTQ
jgi:hypothetical protein